MDLSTVDIATPSIEAIKANAAKVIMKTKRYLQLKIIYPEVIVVPYEGDYNCLVGAFTKDSHLVSERIYFTPEDKKRFFFLNMVSGSTTITEGQKELLGDMEWSMEELRMIIETLLKDNYNEELDYLFSILRDEIQL